jgi:hypothetical protein
LRIHVGACQSYSPAEVDAVMTAAESGDFDPADFPNLTMLQPGEAFAVHVGGQPMLKAACLNKAKVDELLGQYGSELL